MYSTYWKLSLKHGMLFFFFFFSGSTNYTTHKIVNETTFTLFITISKLSLCGMNEVPFLHLLWTLGNFIEQITFIKTWILNEQFWQMDHWIYVLFSDSSSYLSMGPCVYAFTRIPLECCYIFPTSNFWSALPESNSSILWYSIKMSPSFPELCFCNKTCRFSFCDLCVLPAT